MATETKRFLVTKAELATCFAPEKPAVVVAGFDVLRDANLYANEIDWQHLRVSVLDTQNPSEVISIYC